LTMGQYGNLTMGFVSQNGVILLTILFFKAKIVNNRAEKAENGLKFIN